MSNATLPSTMFAAIWLFETRSVCPSGAARAASSIAITPLPPERLSTMTACRHASVSFWPTMRAMMSFAPPGGLPTMRRTGRDGNAGCAAAPSQRRKTKGGRRNASQLAARSCMLLSTCCLPPADLFFILHPSSFIPHPSSSLRLDARFPDHLRPPFPVLAYQLGELRRARAYLRFHSVRSELRFDGRQADDAHDLGVQLPDDGRGRSRAAE